MPETESTEVKTTEVKTFTQDQVNAFMAEEKRKTQAGYADYDAIKAKAAEFDKATEANKTELQKERDLRVSAETKVGGYEQRDQVTVWAKEVVKGSNIPADVLRGSTKEELEAHFEQLKVIAAPPAPLTKRTAVPAGKSDKDDGGSRAVAALRQYRQSAQ